uniref:Uncharacterized protein n=1 Tax=Solanum tuberosum TaxID=4113 RepID=M1DTC0_SOLTU
MANGKAKSSSQNGSAMRPKYSARNLVPCLRCGTTGIFGGLFLGPVGDLGTLAKAVWRVANLEVCSPNGAHLQFLLLA